MSEGYKQLGNHDVRAAQPHIEHDPPVAEGEGGAWGQPGSG